MDTGSQTQVSPPQAVLYGSVAFSPDGNYVYSRLAVGRTVAVYTLYRAPVLGGAPQVLVRDIDSNITFSPNGDRIAFVRSNSPKTGLMSLVASAADGSGEQVLLTEPLTGFYDSTPAWSPDGRFIAYAVPQTADVRGRLTVFDLVSREKRVVLSTNDMVLVHPAWSPDSRGLLFLYAPKTDGFSRRQIGAVSYPDGVFRTITNDTNNYRHLRLPADARSLVSIVSKTTATIAVRPAAADPSSSLASIVESREPLGGFAWTNDGGIVYARGNQLLEHTADGRERVVLAAEGNSRLLRPGICGRSGQIVFEWPNRNGSTTRNLWRTNADGSEPFQLTDLPSAQQPGCSPDGQWVAFISSSGLSRVRTSGGPIELLHPTPAVDSPVWSPDGRTIAILASPEGRAVGRKIVFVSSGAPTRYLDAAADADNLRFTPDGSAVSYLARKAGTMSIHIQPLDGSAPRLMTAPDDAANAQVSPDGSQIAVLRSRNDSDVVLLRDSAAPRR